MDELQEYLEQLKNLSSDGLQEYLDYLRLNADNSEIAVPFILNFKNSQAALFKIANDVVITHHQNKLELEAREADFLLSQCRQQMCKDHASFDATMLVKIISLVKIFEEINKIEDKKIMIAILHKAGVTETEYQRLQLLTQQDQDYRIYETIEFDKQDAYDKKGHQVDLASKKYQKIKAKVSANLQFMRYLALQQEIKIAQGKGTYNIVENQLARSERIITEIIYDKYQQKSSLEEGVFGLVDEVISAANPALKTHLHSLKRLCRVPCVLSGETLFDAMMQKITKLNSICFYWKYILEKYLEINKEAIIAAFDANKITLNIFSQEKLVNINNDFLRIKFPQLVAGSKFQEHYFDFLIKNIPQIYQRQIQLQLPEIEDEIDCLLNNNLEYPTEKKHYISLLVSFEQACLNDNEINFIQRNIDLTEMEIQKLQQQIDNIKKHCNLFSYGYDYWQISNLNNKIRKHEKKKEIAILKRNQLIENKRDTNAAYANLRSFQEAQYFFTHYQCAKQVRQKHAQMIAEEFIKHIKNRIITDEWGEKIGYKDIDLPDGKQKKVPSHVYYIYKQCLKAEQDKKTIYHMNKIGDIGKEASENKPKLLFFNLRTAKAQKFYDLINSAKQQAEEMQQHRGLNH